jgi:hypothetical protein
MNLKQIFCWHDFRLSNPNEVFPSPPKGGGIAFIREHTCKKCSKTRMIGSGMNY